ncbi:MAG: DUF3105 domain-containing protein [Chloroflexota bacterium]
MTRRQVATATSAVNPIVIGSIVLGIAFLGLLLFLNVRGPAPIEGVVQFSQRERGHDSDLVYLFEDYDLPPPGGLHNPTWQNCGIYDDPISSEHVLHSLEHGAVWVTYQPDLPQEQIEALEDAVRNESYALLSPYPNLKSPVVLTAWQVQLELESGNDRRVERFLNRYQNSEFTPERGATCLRGTSDLAGQ